MAGSHPLDAGNGAELARAAHAWRAGQRLA
jgi:hypothetical protein